MLGSRVYSHLLRVPLGYFERRPVGVLVARLAGVETVREFLSGAAVTVALDESGAESIKVETETP